MFPRQSFLCCTDLTTILSWPKYTSWRIGLFMWTMKTCKFLWQQQKASEFDRLEKEFVERPISHITFSLMEVLSDCHHNAFFAEWLLREFSIRWTDERASYHERLAWYVYWDPEQRMIHPIYFRLLTRLLSSNGDQLLYSHPFLPSQFHPAHSQPALHCNADTWRLLEPFPSYWFEITSMSFVRSYQWITSFWRIVWLRVVRLANMRPWDWTIRYPKTISDHAVNEIAYSCYLARDLIEVRREEEP